MASETDKNDDTGVTRREMLQSVAAVAAGGALAPEAAAALAVKTSPGAVGALLGVFFQSESLFQPRHDNYCSLWYDPNGRNLSRFLSGGSWKHNHLGRDDGETLSIDNIAAMVANEVAFVKQKCDFITRIREQVLPQTIPGTSMMLGEWVDKLKPDYMALRQAQIDVAARLLQACPEITGKHRETCMDATALAQKKLWQGQLGDVDLLHGDHPREFASSLLMPYLQAVHGDDAPRLINERFHQLQLGEYDIKAKGHVRAIHKAFQTLFATDTNVVYRDVADSCPNVLFQYQGVDDVVRHWELSAQLIQARFLDAEQVNALAVERLRDTFIHLIIKLGVHPRADQISNRAPVMPQDAAEAAQQLERLRPAMSLLETVMRELPKQIQRQFGITIPVEPEFAALRTVLLRSKAALLKTIQSGAKEDAQHSADGEKKVHNTASVTMMTPVTDEMSRYVDAELGKPNARDGDWLSRTLKANPPRERE